ncbi:hypothetical protein [Rhizorhabdus phycosphaerae]|nr:hypothetical protein [Rhizorhabdus phycosphaerae]
MADQIKSQLDKLKEADCALECDDDHRFKGKLNKMVKQSPVLEKLE